MSIIHLITKDGPEWQVPIEAWTTGRQAELRAAELDKTLSSGTIDTLSKHNVYRIELHGKEAKP